jgi:glycosyltransferase involved in cell wall biosynthesis
MEPPAHPQPVSVLDGVPSPADTAPPRLRQTEGPHLRQASSWPAYFDLSIWFAFLLRSDVHGDADPDQEETRKHFLMWLWCFGRNDYPCAPLRDEQRQVFWEQVPLPSAAEPVLVPRILAFILLARDDVFQGTAAGQPGGGDRALGWLLLWRPQEFDLYDIVDDRLRGWLAAPLASLQHTDGGGNSGDGNGDGEIALTNLGWCVWSLRTDLHAAHDITTAAGRTRFMTWLYTAGLLEEALWPLLPADLAEALDRGVCDIGGRLVSWHAYLCWLTWLQETPIPSPTTAQGAALLDDWYRRLRPSFLAVRRPAPLPPPPARRRPAHQPLPPPTRQGCNLIGYARSELGVGEDVRMMAASLHSNAVPFSVIDRSAYSQSRGNDRTCADQIGEDFSHTATVLCFTGFDTARFFLHDGGAAMQNRYVIGYWPWELPRWPQPWHAVFSLVDEIWVSSRYTQDAFSLQAPIPVLHMPMAVEITAPAPLTRRQLGLPENAFLFLYVFDAHSYLDRKNPIAAVQAFRRAFPAGNEPVGLVLKVMNGKNDHPGWRALLDRTAGDPRIRIIDATWDKPQSLALAGLCDGYVSLHRAEGFGRTIAEAMLLGKPVIATAWSGSDEIVRPDTALPVPARLVPVEPGQYPGGEGMWWADPDIDYAAWAMQRLVADPALCARLAAAGQAFIRQRHNPQVIGQRYRERLTALGLL